MFKTIYNLFINSDSGLAVSVYGNFSVLLVQPSLLDFSDWFYVIQIAY